MSTDVLFKWNQASAALKDLGPVLSDALQQHGQILMRHEKTMTQYAAATATSVAGNTRVQGIQAEVAALAEQVKDLRKVATTIQSEITTQQERLVVANESLQQQRVQFSVQQEQWIAFTSRVFTSNTRGAVVKLRVGEQEFHTSTNTLLASGSMFSALVSSNFHNTEPCIAPDSAATSASAVVEPASLDPDEFLFTMPKKTTPVSQAENSSFFIDRCPKHFGKVLNFFRSGVFPRFDYLLGSAFPVWLEYDEDESEHVFDMEPLTFDEEQEWAELLAEVSFYQISALLLRQEDRIEEHKKSELERKAEVDRIAAEKEIVEHQRAAVPLPRRRRGRS